ncbi:phospholipase D-like domain-containing protein [Paenibacillus sp. CC-CFT747]|nr:phospholipase D-like domain-containing protein [Paenibacillus sp. CC-CFT747]
MASPYFIPDASLIMALKTAALSGVDVRILVPSVPDSRLIQLASFSYLEELMQTGIRFYRYKKGFLHSKIMLVDDAVATVGTMNLDMRSFFCNFELSAVLYGRGTLDRLAEDFDRDLAASEELQLDSFARRPAAQKAGEIVLRILSPLL